jgi:hypothetical protein
MKDPELEKKQYLHSPKFGDQPGTAGVGGASRTGRERFSERWQEATKILLAEC